LGGPQTDCACTRAETFFVLTLMKTRLALAALAATLPVAATPPVHVPELSSTLPLLAGGLILLGVLASRLKK